MKQMFLFLIPLFLVKNNLFSSLQKQVHDSHNCDDIVKLSSTCLLPLVSGISETH